MVKISYKEVKEKCTKDRFFPYDDWRDKLFVPPSIFLVWVFVKFKVSGNSVSLLSGFVAIIGGILIASQNNIYILFGSFSYMLYYLLDYVDGGVARFNGSSGIGGQYIDWLMHTVSSLGIFIGIFIGALNASGIWAIPMGILTLIACALNLERYSFGWFSICMHYQQQIVKNNIPEQIPLKISSAQTKSNRIFRFMKYFSALIFHENYSIFLIPVLAIFNLFINKNIFDFRLIILFIGAFIYFPVILFDIFRISNNKIIDKSYNDIFFGNYKPILPKDHFFES
jgi:hypothetical protein